MTSSRRLARVRWRAAAFVILFFLSNQSVKAEDPPTVTPSPMLDSAGRLTVMEENDYFVSNDDRNYTQGMRLSSLSGRIIPDDIWDQPYVWLSRALPIFGGGD